MHEKTIEALRAKLKKETEEYTASLEADLGTKTEHMDTAVRNHAMGLYNEMKARHAEDDERSLERFEKTLRLLGEDHRTSLEEIMNIQIKSNREALADFKKKHLG